MKVQAPGDVHAAVAALNDDDVGTRYRGGWALQRLASTAAVESGDAIALAGAVAPLLAALRDPSAAVRTVAAEALGAIKDERAVEGLIATLDDWDSSVTCAAARALGAIGEGRATPRLVRLVLAWNGEYPSPTEVDYGTTADYGRSAHVAAAEALRQIGDPDALEPLLAALNGDPYCPTGAAHGLGILGDPRAVPSLLDALRDPGFFDKATVIGALGQIGDLRSVDPLVETLEEPALDYWAAAALGSIGDKRAVGPLMSAFERQGPDRSVQRSGIVRALERIGDPETIELLIETLRDSNDGLRQAAVSALGTIGDARAVRPLLELIGNIESNKASGAQTFRIDSVVYPLITVLGRQEPKSLTLDRPESVLWTTDPSDDLCRSAFEIRPALYRVLDDRSRDEWAPMLDDLASRRSARIAELRISPKLQSDPRGIHKRRRR